MARTMHQRSQDGNHDRSGKFTKGPACYRCKKPAGHNYASHPMTDCVGDDGQPWHDTALVLCRYCYTRCDHMRNVSEFKRYRDTGYY